MASRMPGEFEPHQGCWMLWPWRPDNWRGRALPAQRAFAAVAEAIARFEPVTVGARVRNTNSLAALPPAVRVVEPPATMLDARRGPHLRGRSRRHSARRRLALQRLGRPAGRPVLWDRDDLVARKVLEIERLDLTGRRCQRRRRDPFGRRGTLLVTEQCLLNRNRNPQITGAQIEALLKSYTGPPR